VAEGVPALPGYIPADKEVSKGRNIVTTQRKNFERSKKRLDRVFLK
jgi:hypothetical protein